LGLGAGKQPSRNGDLAPVLAAAMGPAAAAIHKTNFFYKKMGSWSVNAEVTDYVIDDPMMRASINFYGPAWHLAPEALYFPATAGADGKPLTGDRRYKIRFPKGRLPPVDAFWSLTMYGDRFSLVDNAIDRYTINSYTDVVHGADGALEIYVQHEPPAQGTTNWLPSPATGPFMLFIRVYQPRPSLIDGSYLLPAIEPA
jgi:hypothetical protein